MSHHDAQYRSDEISPNQGYTLGIGYTLIISNQFAGVSSLATTTQLLTDYVFVLPTA
jgi:hypothetical protein